MKVFLQILQFFPYVLSGVAAVEQVVGATLPGAAKKQIVLDSITAAAATGTITPDAQVQVISTLIDAIVTALNKSGVFAKVTAPVV